MSRHAAISDVEITPDMIEAGRGSAFTGGIPPHAAERYAAIETLARLFFWELEKLDPSGHYEMEAGPEAAWLSLTDSERGFFVSALERSLCNRDLVLRALGQRLAKNDTVDRREGPLCGK